LSLGLEQGGRKEEGGIQGGRLETGNNKQLIKTPISKTRSNGSLSSNGGSVRTKKVGKMLDAILDAYLKKILGCGMRNTIVDPKLVRSPEGIT